MLNFYDMYAWGSQIPAGNDSFVFNIVDRSNKLRFYFSGAKAGGPSNGASWFNIFDKNESEILALLDDGNENIRLQFGKPNTRVIIGGYSNYPASLAHKLFVQNGSAKIEGNIFTDSNIGIGTSSFVDGADTYRLSVDGAIRASRVKVYTTWADYVFEKDYKLPTLEEVEKHIAEKGHLQDIPSAKEVEQKGIELGEMNKLLLQKVEELTLYIIEMNKELQAVKGQIKNN